MNKGIKGMFAFAFAIPLIYFPGGDLWKFLTMDTPDPVNSVDEFVYVCWVYDRSDSTDQVRLISGINDTELVYIEGWKNCIYTDTTKTK